MARYLRYVLPVGRAIRETYEMLILNAGRSMLVAAGCSVLALTFVGEAQSREEPRDGARSKALTKEAPARKDKASQVERNASVEEEPFCVRPFEYPRQSR
jgi:hypothetical protein